MNEGAKAAFEKARANCSSAVTGAVGCIKARITNGQSIMDASNAARTALDAATKSFAMNEGAKAAFEKARATCSSAVTGAVGCIKARTTNGQSIMDASNAARTALDAATKSFAMNEGAKVAFEKARATCGSAVTGLRELKWERVPQAAVERIEAHPYLTAMQVSSILVAFVPGLAWSPALTGLGFGTAGPTAGYLAPAFQSAFGTPIYFSALQSAAMGGWGVNIVNIAVQGIAVATGVLSEVAAKRLSSKL